VLDISDLTRLGMLSDRARRRSPGSLCGPPRERRYLAARPRLLDPDAAATGELIFEIAKANDWPVTKAVAERCMSPF